MSALVLTGSGAKGAFCAGLLTSYGKPYTSVYGISSGAINAVAYSAGIGEYGQLWCGVSSIFDIFSLKWNLVGANGIFKASPLLKLLSGHIPSPPVGCLFSYPVYNLSTGRLKWFKESDYTPSSLVSACSIAGLVHTDDFMIDAGSYIITPLSRAIRDGHDTITVVLSDDPRLFNFSHSITGHALGFVGMILNRLMVRDIQTAISFNDLSSKRIINLTVLCPTISMYSPLSFSNCRRGYNAGMSGYYREMSLSELMDFD